MVSMHNKVFPRLFSAELIFLPPFSLSKGAKKAKKSKSKWTESFFSLGESNRTFDRDAWNKKKEKKNFRLISLFANNI